MPSPIPPTRPVAGPATAVAPKVQSAESRAIAASYRRLENDLVSQGLLRTDGGGPDVPFSARMLADNFIRIALYDEYINRGGVLVASETESRLRRWDTPVRMNVEFGATIPADQRVRDRNSITAYVNRLSRISGHPATQVKSGANFNVLVLNEDERRAIAPRLRALVPGIDNSAVRTITDLPQSTLCLVFAFSEGSGSSSYMRAVAVIRGEHPPLLRLSCIHEELAQGLGLANDSPAARPSIFNDDEEFGLLTTQDEMMLKILYDRRLRTGMTLAEARPIVDTIARELMGGES
jgi:hypothetical protein